MSALPSSVRHRPAAATMASSPAASPLDLPQFAETETRRPGAQTPGKRTTPRFLPSITGYEVVRQLGLGGMGIVYLANEAALNRQVAIKVVAGGVFADTEMLTRFRLEAEAIARLQHPNIVQIFRVGRTDGGDAYTPQSPYIALEYVSGGTLAQRVREPICPRVAARLVATLARAIQYAHDRGIVHRDLKPGNVLLHCPSIDGTGCETLESFVPKVTDFGLAKRLNVGDELAGDSHTVAGSMLGTPEYMSPEQASTDAEIGPAADIYALGVILYELLTAQLPHKGVDALDTLLLVRTVDPLPPSRWQPRLPRDLDTICERCLQKEPAKRYASAGDLAHDLEAWLDGRPIAARPVRAFERTVKWVRRRPAIAALLGAVAILAVGGFAGVLWQWQRAEARAVAEKVALDQASQALEESENHLYFSRVHTARNDILVGNMADAERALDACRPDEGERDRRSWEWHYLKNASRHEAFSFLASAHWVWDVAFSPDGRYLATAAGTPFFPDAETTPGDLAIWDAHTGKLVRRFEGHTGAVRRVGFSPDGRWIAASGYDKTVRVWEVATGQAVGAAIPGVIVHHFHRTMYGDSSRFWFAADSKSIVVQGPDGWEKRNLTGSVDEPRPELEGLMYRTPDGRLALVSRGGSIVEVMSLPDRKILGRFEHHEGIDRAVLKPDAKTVILTTEARIEAFDVATGRRTKSFDGPTAFVEALTLSPVGERMAATGVDRTVYVWDPAWPYPVAFHGHQADVRNVAFSPDGERLASCDRSGRVFVWDMARRPRQQLVHSRGSADGVPAVGVSADGSRVLVAHLSQTLRHLDMNGDVLKTVTVPGLSKKTKYPRYDMQFSADGVSLYGPREDEVKVVCRWDTGSGAVLREFRGHQFTIGPLTLSADGRRLATCANSRPKDSAPISEIIVWDTETGNRVSTIIGETAVGLALSTDGARLATAHRNGDLLVRDSVSGAEVWRQRNAHADDDEQNHGVWVFALAFSPDDKLLASGGFGDGLVKLWRTDTGQGHLAPLPSRPSLTGVAFTPDGRRVLSCGYDSEMRFWDVATGQIALILPPPSGSRHGDIAFTARPIFSQFNQRLAMLDWRGFVSCWNGREAGAEER